MGRERILGQLGVDRYVRRSAVAPQTDVAEAERATDTPPPVEATTAAVAGDAGVPDWEQLREQVAACRRCALHETRTQTVFGVGDLRARWLVIGEAPGADEDAKGEPFVGRAGQLLNEMIRAVGLQRDQVYIANILKCRPPNNRDPKPEEAASCREYLDRQIQWIAPALILAVGRIAAQNLLGVETPIGKLRGSVHRLPGGTPVVVTYHPAYLLRSPLEKRRAWDDLRLALRVTREGGAVSV